MASSFPPEEAKSYLFRLVELLQYYINDQARTDTSLKGTVAEVQSGLKALHDEIIDLEFTKDYITPEDFEGSNEEKFAQAVEYAKNNGAVIKLTKDYTLTENLELGTTWGKRLRIDGNDHKITFTVGHGVDLISYTTLENLTIQHSNYYRTVEGVRTPHDLEDAGVNLHGTFCYLSRVNIINFGTGILSHGKSEGVQYNYMEYVHCRNCIQGLYFQASLFAEDGQVYRNWTNENALIYSKITQDTAYRTFLRNYDEEYETTFAKLYAITLKTDHWESVGGTNKYPHPISCNKFIGTDVEGCCNGMWVCGVYNVFLSVRTEDCEQDYFFALMDYPGATGTKFCRDNWVIAPWSSLSITADPPPVKEEYIYTDSYHQAGDTRYYNRIFAPGYPYKFGRRVHFEDGADSDTSIYTVTDNNVVKFVFAPKNADAASISSRGVQTAHGSTRPTVTSADVGTMFFDTTLNKPIWVNSSGAWVDATGTGV